MISDLDLDGMFDADGNNDWADDELEKKEYDFHFLQFYLFQKQVFQAWYSMFSACFAVRFVIFVDNHFEDLFLQIG